MWPRKSRYHSGIGQIRSGAKGLKKSQIYPPRYGRHVAQTYQKYMVRGLVGNRTYIGIPQPSHPCRPSAVGSMHFVLRSTRRIWCLGKACSRPIVLVQTKYHVGPLVMIIWLYIFYIGVVCQGPYKWRHAALAPVKSFLRSEIRAGRFTPQFDGGLEDWYHCCTKRRSGLCLFGGKAQEYYI